MIRNIGSWFITRLLAIITPFNGRVMALTINIICNICFATLNSYHSVFFNTHTQIIPATKNAHTHTYTRHHALHVKKGAYKLRSCFKHYTVEYVEGTCQRW